MQALLDALRQLAELVLAFLAGELKGKLEAVNEQQQRDLEASQAAAVVSAMHAGLNDDELRKLAVTRAERLRARLKARAADGNGGGDD